MALTHRGPVRVTRRTDVVVIGAGLSGLAAANALSEAQFGVIVLEARDRVGGRTLTVTPIPGAPLDLGAQWVTRDHTTLRALAQDLHLQLLDMPQGGDLTLLADGERLRLSETEVAATLELDNSTAAALEALDELAASVDPEAPWEHPDATWLDGRTFGSWLDDHVIDAQVLARLTAAAEGYFASPLGEVSLLHALVYARSNGGFAHLLGPEGDPARQQRLAGGAQSLAHGLAARLGDRVLLSRPVTLIEYDQDQAIVHAGTDAVRANAVVIAMPPALIPTLAFSPPLPWQRRHLMQRVAMGSGLKAHFVYPEPYWRSEGASGQILDLDTGFAAFDATVDSGPGIIVALPTITESRGLALDPLQRRRATLLQRLTRALGTSARDPIHYQDRMWAWETSSEGEVSVFGCGAWSAFGHTLRAPVGCLFFAGTETATQYAGQMEGALRAGQRAAVEAANHLP